MESAREMTRWEESGLIGVCRQILSPRSPLSLEHASQGVADQAAVGLLCAVGGYLIAYWSLQGLIGLAVILICVAFSTMVTAALCHYYERLSREAELSKQMRRSLSGGFGGPVRGS